MKWCAEDPTTKGPCPATGNGCGLLLAAIAFATVILAIGVRFL